MQTESFDIGQPLEEHFDPSGGFTGKHSPDPRHGYSHEDDFDLLLADAEAAVENSLGSTDWAVEDSLSCVFSALEDSIEGTVVKLDPQPEKPALFEDQGWVYAYPQEASQPEDPPELSYYLQAQVTLQPPFAAGMFTVSKRGRGGTGMRNASGRQGSGRYCPRDGDWAEEDVCEACEYYDSDNGGSCDYMDEEE